MTGAVPLPAAVLNPAGGALGRSLVGAPCEVDSTAPHARTPEQDIEIAPHPPEANPVPGP